MFCKAKRKKVLYFSVFLLSLSTPTSRSILPLLVCVELNVSSISLSFMFFGRSPHVWSTDWLTNSYCSKSKLVRYFFFQGQPGSPFSSIFKLMLLRDVVTFRLLRWHCTVDANNLPKHGVNVTRNSTKTKTFYLSNKQLNVLSPVMLLASSVFLNSMETKIWHAQMQVG